MFREQPSFPPEATCSFTCCKSGRATGRVRYNNCALTSRATMADRFLLDTSAFLTFLQGEPGAPRVLELLEKAARHEAEVFASFVSLTEVQYITFHDFGDEAAKKAIADLKCLAVSWQHSDEALCASAAEVKARHKVSFADAFVAAAALRVDAVLVHKDPEFVSVSALVKQEMLPPKTFATPAAGQS